MYIYIYSLYAVSTGESEPQVRANESCCDMSSVGDRYTFKSINKQHCRRTR